MEQMRIVVTGGTGFIGCNLIAFLKKKGHFVRCVGREIKKKGKSRGLMFKRADEVLKLDLRRIKDAQKAVEGMDFVVHLASDISGAGYFAALDYYPFINNMRMDMNILEACEKAKSFKRLFYPASFSIYPVYLQTQEKAPKLSEDMIYPADSDLSYGWEKLMMLRLCESAPIDARVGIFGAIFGPYQEIDGGSRNTTSVFAIRAIESLKSGEYEIWGNQKQTRSFMYIDDALEKIYRCLMSKKYGGPVNIASSEAVSFQEVAQMCCDIVGSCPKFVYKSKGPGKVFFRSSDNSKFERIYGFKNRYTTRQGFEKLIKFLRT